MSHVATSASTSAVPPVPPFSRFRFLTVASARLFLAAGASKALRRFADATPKSENVFAPSTRVRSKTAKQLSILSLVFGTCSSSGTPAASSSRLRRWVASMKGAASQRCAHGMAHPAASVAIK